MAIVPDVDDPAFLTRGNLRTVVTFGLACGVLSGLTQALLHDGFDHVNLVVVVVLTLWPPLALVALHLALRRRSPR